MMNLFLYTVFQKNACIGFLSVSAFYYYYGIQVRRHRPVKT